MPSPDIGVTFELAMPLDATSTEALRDALLRAFGHPRARLPLSPIAIHYAYSSLETLVIELATCKDHVRFFLLELREQAVEPGGILTSPRCRYTIGLHQL